MPQAAPILGLDRKAGILSFIGNTPLVRLSRVGAEYHGIEIYGKAEYFNPGGSVKDRPALNMILDGERNGRLFAAHGQAGFAPERLRDAEIVAQPVGRLDDLGPAR